MIKKKINKFKTGLGKNYNCYLVIKDTRYRKIVEFKINEFEINITNKLLNFKGNSDDENSLKEFEGRV